MQAISAIAQQGKVINLLPAKDISSSAHAATYVAMNKFGHATFIVQMGATGAIGSSKNISFTEAVNTSGSSSAALPVNSYWTNSAALASASIANDTYVKTAVGSSAATVALTASTNNVTYVFEIEASELSSGKDCVGVAVAATSAAAICGVAAILTGARYKQASPPSAL